MSSAIASSATVDVDPVAGDELVDQVELGLGLAVELDDAAVLDPKRGLRVERAREGDEPERGILGHEVVAADRPRRVVLGPERGRIAIGRCSSCPRILGAGHAASAGRSGEVARNRPLQPQEELLVVQPAGVAAEAAVRADHPVAGHDDRDRVRRAGVPGGAGRPGLPARAASSV